MTTIAEAFEVAWDYFQSGHFQQAEQVYRRILQADPSNAQALYLVGAANQAQGRLAEAEASYRRALQLAPDSRLAPDSAEVHTNLGIALARQGKPAEAEASFRRVSQLRPDSAEAHTNLGIALADQGRLEEAEASYRRALRLAPDSAKAHYNLGVALARQGKPAEAEASYRRALQLAPDSAEAYTNLGIALADQGRLEEAEASYRRALRLAPDSAEAHYNLGIALADQGKPAEAEASHERALRLRPDDPEAHSNLGSALADQGRLEEAEASFRRALRLAPDCAEAHYNLGVVLRLLGDFERGSPEYEWRWKCKGFSPPPFHQPLWDGSPLAGRTILLHAEQGLGDTIQFIRYAPLVQRRGGRVVVACQGPLARLLAHCPGIDRLIVQGDAPPPFDVHAPLMSLPWILGTTLSSIPAEVPYLGADPVPVERWCREMGPIEAFKIGVAWQGNPRHRHDRHRSFRLAQLAPVARLAGVRLYSLQKGPGVEQLGEVADRFPVTDLGSRLDEAAGAFLDTAAVMKGLDLVITADTALAHLAGALGVPAWVALPFAPDWRWLLGREDSPWYPTLRLFRQSAPGDWAGVFDRMAAALAGWRATPARGGSG